LTVDLRTWTATQRILYGVDVATLHHIPSSSLWILDGCFLPGILVGDCTAFRCVLYVMVSHSHHGTHHAWLSYVAVILDQDTPLSQHPPSRLLLLPRRHKNGNVEKVVVVIKKPSNTKLVSREQGHPFFSWRRLHYIRFLPPNNPPSQCDPRSPSTVWHALGHALMRSRVYQ